MEVWENIKRDAAASRGVGAMDGGGAAATTNGDDGSTSRDVIDCHNDRRMMTGADMTRLADVYSSILSQCKESGKAVRACASKSECRKAHSGMTICARNFACPLQHSSFMASLDAYGTGSTSDDIAEARIDAAMEILGKCVSGDDRDASVGSHSRRQIVINVVMLIKETTTALAALPRGAGPDHQQPTMMRTPARTTTSRRCSIGTA